MVFTGVHGYIGIIVSKLFFKSSKNWEYAKWGIVVGSIFPDVDLFGSVLIYLLTRDQEATIGFHRTITHSFVVLGIIALLGAILLLKDKGLLTNSTFFGSFLIAFAIGGVFHSLFDIIYFDGVALFWPIIPEKGWNMIGISFQDTPELFQKVMATLDGYFEPFFWLGLAYSASKNNTTNSITLLGKEIQNFPNKLKKLSFIALIPLPIYLYIAFFIPMTVEDYVILLYVTVIFILFFSEALVFIMKETLMKI